MGKVRTRVLWYIVNVKKPQNVRGVTISGFRALAEALFPGIDPTSGFMYVLYTVTPVMQAQYQNLVGVRVSRIKPDQETEVKPIMPCHGRESADMGWRRKLQAKIEELLSKEVA